MNAKAIQALVAGMCIGVAVTLGWRKRPQPRSAWPDLAGEFAL